MDAACQLTFIKQAVKRQITGYDFIISASPNRSPGAEIVLWMEDCVELLQFTGQNQSNGESRQLIQGSERRKETDRQTGRQTNGLVSCLYNNTALLFQWAGYRKMTHLTMFANHYSTHY